MNDHFFSVSDKSPSLKKLMKPDRASLKRIIDDLVSRREQHEQRINKLLDPSYHNGIMNSSPSQGHIEISQMLRKLEIEQPQALQESIGGLANHVNLLATVSLKTDYFLSEKPHIKQYGKLYKSLINKFGKKKIIYHFDQNEPVGVVQLMKLLVKFLVEQELIKGLFVLSQAENGNIDFYGTRFDKGKYQQILLSNSEIQQEQSKLVILSKQQGIQSIDISWLLLTRLLNTPQNLNFPLAMNRLFSFPYKQYFIKKSLQLIKFNELLGILINSQNSKEEKTIKIYGIQKTGETCEISNISKSQNFKSYINSIHRFNSLLIMNEVQFPVKSIPLSCLKHHFVVVTLVVKGDDDYYLSVGGENMMQRFRLCLLDFEGNLVQYETINSGQFMFCALREQQYELHISPEEIVEEGNSLQESYELVKQSQQHFCLWLQGRSVFTEQGNIQLQIRLKQQYNSYTLKIAKKYIEQAKRYQQRIPIFDQSEIVVKRFILTQIGLVLDEFIAPNHQKISVKYKTNTLCDQYFQENCVNLSNNQSIVLREETEIQSIASSKDQNHISINYKIYRYFF